MQSKNEPEYMEYFAYDRLARASEKLHLNPAVPENEERLMDLHNHLVWRSYRFGQDETADAIFCTAIRDVMTEFNLQKENVPLIFLAYLEAQKGGWL